MRICFLPIGTTLGRNRLYQCAIGFSDKKELRGALMWTASRGTLCNVDGPSLSYSITGVMQARGKDDRSRAVVR